MNPFLKTLLNPWKLSKDFSPLVRSVRMMGLIPYVIERNSGGERAYDIYSRLLRDRIVCLHGSVDGAMASSIIAQLLYLESVQPDKAIYMYINSPGGSVSDGLSIYDTMQFIQCPVHTVCMGLAASMGSLLLAAGSKGHRLVLPNCRIMIHQPIGGAKGQASDIAIHAKEILRVREQLNRLYAKHTGQPVDVIEKSMERDTYMSPAEALAYGLVDKVIEKRELSTVGSSTQNGHVNQLLSQANVS